MLDKVPRKIYVKERPGLKNFLHTMNEHYEIMIFTASQKEVHLLN